MKIQDIQIQKSPDSSRAAQLSAGITYDDSGGTERIWYEVDEQYASDLNQTADPWVAAMLPLASKLHEPIIIDAPISELFYENIPRLVAVWQSWYPELVQVEIEHAGFHHAEKGTRKGTFFTAGVDSFFTVLHKKAHSDHIDDLLTVWGFDIGLDNASAFQRLASRIQNVAMELDCNVIPVSTNLRETRFSVTDWGRLAHGAALASVAHALGPRFNETVLASSYPLSDLFPWGTHPVTDPFLSTERTTLAHHGARYDRVEKTRFISGYDIALKHLHVCYRNRDDENCGDCLKCLRTMLTLQLYDALDQASTFNFKRAPQERFCERLKGATKQQMVYARRIRDMARKLGREDTARALDDVIEGESASHIHRFSWLDRVRRRVASRARLREILGPTVEG